MEVICLDNGRDEWLVAHKPSGQLLGKIGRLNDSYRIFVYDRKTGCFNWHDTPFPDIESAKVAVTVVTKDDIATPSPKWLVVIDGHSGLSCHWCANVDELVNVVRCGGVTAKIAAICEGTPKQASFHVTLSDVEEN